MRINTETETIHRIKRERSYPNVIFYRNQLALFLLNCFLLHSGLISIAITTVLLDLELRKSKQANEQTNYAQLQIDHCTLFGKWAANWKLTIWPQCNIDGASNDFNGIYLDSS